MADSPFRPQSRPYGALVLLLFLVSGLVGCNENQSMDSTPMPTTVAQTADTLTVDDVLRTDQRFSTLIATLDSTGLDSVLAGGGPYTMFAPPNSSFQILPDGTLNVLVSERRDQLHSILAHHVVPGRVSLDSLSSRRTFVTLSGDSVEVRPADSTVAVGAARVLDGDIPVANGIIHVVDAVLRPPRSDDR